MRVSSAAERSTRKTHPDFVNRRGRANQDSPAINVANAFHKPNHAFGVDPRRKELYSLRQARYDAAARDVSDWAQTAAEDGQVLCVLDVGCGDGTFARHLEPRPYFRDLRLDGADIRTHRNSRTDLYQKIFMSDLMSGQTDVPTGAYDVVVCEQVLEHLERLDLAIAALERVLKPGGRLVVGVPVFVRPLAWLRGRYVRLSQILRPELRWSHVQSFSLSSFLKTMRRCSKLEFAGARGFRIVSEGLVAPLENYRWWWKMNRNIGARIPWACTEIQAIFVKNARLDFD